MALSTAQYQELDSARFHIRLRTISNCIRRRSNHRSAGGVYLFDSDGNRLLNAMAGLWCVNMGYGRKILRKSQKKSDRTTALLQRLLSNCSSPVIELSSLLAEVTPDHLNRVFLTNSGSESNDTVVRMVRHYWHSLGQPEKQVIISRKNAYHGSTMAGASLGGCSNARAGVAHPGYFSH